MTEEIPPPGLTILSNIVTEEEQTQLLNGIDSHPWSHVLQRRVQMYGGVYDYKTRRVSTNNAIPMSECPGKALIERLLKWKYSVPEFNQAIVNEYKTGQSISAHYDATCFGPLICSISLGDSTTMTFTPQQKIDINTNKKKYSVELKKGDVMIMTNESRYVWTHQTKASNSDPNYRRISITFRSF